MTKKRGSFVSNGNQPPFPKTKDGPTSNERREMEKKKPAEAKEADIDKLSGYLGDGVGSIS